MRNNTDKTRNRPRWVMSVLALGLMAGVSGCDSWLAVVNPNEIPASGTQLPVAASGFVRGAEATVMRGYSQITTSYSTVTDELDWVGSRDAFQQHDFGNMADPYNEFTDDEFRYISEGRWMADYAVEVLTAHDATDSLKNRTDLAKANILAGAVRIIIADMFDDFVFSSRDTSGTPIGAANMGTLYDQAVDRLTTAMAIATAEGDNDMAVAARALRARAHHAKAVWGKVGTRPIDTSDNGLVSSAAAVADAQAVLADADGGDDFTYGFQFSSDVFRADVASWVNSRQEMRVGAVYAEPHATKPTYLAVWLEDPIDAGTMAPELVSLVAAFKTFYPYMPLVTGREMHLIIAEDALAAPTDMNGFENAINDLRTMDGLTDFVDGDPGMPLALDLLNHSRMTNLWMQGRRLADMYRFGIVDAMWQAGSTALTAPGTFLPITVIECRANTNINDSC